MKICFVWHRVRLCCILFVVGLMAAAAFPERAAATTLHQFCIEAPCTDGQFPLAGLMNDGHDHFYGTTEGGGAHGRGVLFEVVASGNVNVLHSFCELKNCTDGSLPLGNLAIDGSGNIYGTTETGGTSSVDPDGGQGTVFKYTPGNGSFTVIYNFCSAPPLGSCRDGAEPQSGVIVDGAGNLYGTTVSGGNSANEWGAVYRLTPSAEGYTESVLHSFCSGETACITDGANPFGGLVMDSAGSLYGTTACGGSGTTIDDNTCGGGGGAGGSGIVFKLTNVGPRWKETILHRFCAAIDCNDGATPFAGLIIDTAGNLYGTTSQGGKFGGGTAFELTSGTVGLTRIPSIISAIRPTAAMVTIRMPVCLWTAPAISTGRPSVKRPRPRTSRALCSN